MAWKTPANRDMPHQYTRQRRDLRLASSIQYRLVSSHGIRPAVPPIDFGALLLVCILEGEYEMDNLRVRLIIEGRVQGVWFRDSTRRQAVALGVTGWVRNRRDGAVEVLAEGPEGPVRRLIAWCNRGPSSARVNQVHETTEEWRGEFDGFEIVF